jgi:hypothetical protein
VMMMVGTGRGLRSSSCRPLNPPVGDRQSPGQGSRPGRHAGPLDRCSSRSPHVRLNSIVPGTLLGRVVILNDHDLCHERLPPLGYEQTRRGSYVRTDDRPIMSLGNGVVQLTLVISKPRPFPGCARRERHLPSSAACTIFMRTFVQPRPNAFVGRQSTASAPRLRMYLL